MSEKNRQFDELVKVIEEMAAGNLGARYPISDKHDETDAIGAAVNILTEELSATIEELEDEIAEHRATTTELAAAERGRDRINEELEQLQTARFASLGMLAGGIGHEINNPLTYVIGNLDYLRDVLAERRDASDPAQEELQELIGKSLEGAERIRVIVRDFGRFAQVGEDDPREQTVVREVVEEALSAVHGEIRHRAELIVEYRDEPIILTSRSRLLQVLVNLLINAAHSLGNVAAAENKIRVSVAPAGVGEVKIEIADTGEGISEADLPRIFDPFFTTKAKSEGTGLGLSICRELVSKLGGEIAVESSPGKGTKFVLTLPRGEGALETFASARTPAATGDRRPLRILIVDDELWVAQSLQRKLGDADTMIATGGQEAIDLLDSDSAFDIVFCDLMMPTISGMDVYDAIGVRSSELASRFVFITGGAFTERARNFVESVSNPCIEKPFDSAVLKRLISNRELLG
ncbi:MAG: response regulator [Deltaproteobacteria bacterium]|nr:response regulator [Deltaproteobacteria bacterium]